MRIDRKTHKLILDRADWAAIDRVEGILYELTLRQSESGQNCLSALNDVKSNDLIMRKETKTAPEDAAAN